ncbi:MAG: 4'-phosphopantetheinyl transferase family protein [Vicinamibacterales bacterium]
MRRLWVGGASDVHAFFCRTEALDVADLDAAVALLSYTERERHARFGFAHDRREYAVAHALVRVVVGEALGVPARDVELTADENGRPLIARSDSRPHPPALSLSHCRGVVACAVSPDGIVGIDVETIDAAVDLWHVASDYFTAAERDGLEHCDGAARLQRFYALWTLKEALFKATGIAPGQLGGGSFTFADDGAVSLTPSSVLPPRSWCAGVVDIADHCKLAIVASRPPGSARERRLHEFDAAAFSEVAMCYGSRPVPTVSASPQGLREVSTLSRK